MLGSPIAHSKSPALHAAAYSALGLDWRYEAIEVAEDGLAGFIKGLDASWRGLSLTMPLKRAVLPMLDVRDGVVDHTGVANTVLFDDGLRGFNTDVYGITEAFRSNGVVNIDSVQILGGGATAISALVAAADLGATSVQFTLRDPAKGGALLTLAESLGVGVVDSITPSAVISTVPGHADHSFEFSDEVRANAVLLDVAYDPWPSALAALWRGPVISGLEMLTLQALAQVRVFVGGSPDAVLDDESSVLAAMRGAVGL